MPRNSAVAALARSYADSILADPDALADYEAGLLDVPPEVERYLERALPRSSRDHVADDVNIIRGTE